MAEVRTPWTEVSDGDTTQLDLSGVSSLDYVKIRWRGVKDEYDYNISESTGTIYTESSPFDDLSGCIPALQSYESHVKHRIQVILYDSNHQDFVQMEAQAYDNCGGAVSRSKFTSQNVKSYTLEWDNITSRYEQLGGLIIFSQPWAQCRITFLTVTHADKKTKYPKVAIDTVETNPSIYRLLDGEESDWFTLNNINAGEINSLVHSINESELVEYQIEYLPSLPAMPSNDTPAESWDRYFENFEFTAEENPEVPGPYHCEITVRGTTYFSKDNQTNWYYYNGGSWIAFPAAGVPVNSEVRFVSSGFWDLGIYEWSAKSYAEIEGTWQSGQSLDTSIEITRMPAPSLVSPGRGTRIENRDPWFTFIIPDVSYETGQKYEARIRISNYLSMTPVNITLDSKLGTGTWEYYDGATWQNWPIGGVDPGTSVRVKRDIIFDYGIYYWDAAYQDDFDWSTNLNAARLFIVISVNIMYSLFIEGVAYSVYDLNVTEASNGELGDISFTLLNDEGTTNAAINYLDTIDLVIHDTLGNEEDFKGIVKNKNPQGKFLHVSAITGDGILADRRIDENYLSQDVGLTMKQIIDTYCQPLTSNNINTTTGFVRAINANNKKPLQIAEELRREYDLYYFVDDDWDFHFYKVSEIGSSVITIRYGDV